MQFGQVIFAVFSIWIGFKVTYNDAVLFKFSNAVCQSSNESWIVVHKCRLKAVSRNVTTFNFNGTLLHPVNNLWVHGQVLKKANGYKPWVLKADIDVCRFHKRLYNPIAKLVYKLFREFSNLNHTCPYVGPQIIDGFYLKWDYLPHAFPTGEYLITLNWLFDKRPQIFTNLYFTFTEDL